MNISSNTLFHFTKDIKTLKSILEHNFWPSLSIEENFKRYLTGITMSISVR